MSKDIHGCFSPSSKRSASSIDTASSKNIPNSDSEDFDNEPVTKKLCHSLSKIHPTSTASKSITILKDGRQILSGWSMMKIYNVLFVNSCTAKSG